ncbi:uncharacterized mitochondrial protein AtMg00810-like [Lathyrus oleraceus]|uniref:uncharacterized mitochondrial protein AtMg00810-like n=1 Tax=Pisum sativum TaxID=3888 RepID=UPI0021D1DA2E|nr:uncharacterized mitochondrial protein AtMg00810-like [Pisum sativum]
MTLHLVDMSHGCRSIICKRVLKRKLKPDGTIDKYKARLVAKDDLLIFGSNTHIINDVKSLLRNNFDMKDLGEARVILGIKITRFEQGISLDQSHFVEKILKKHNYFDCKPVITPYDPSVKLFKNTGEILRQTEYGSIIGSLRYATDCTRPYIAYVRFPVVLEGYSGADWNTLSDDSKETSGYVFNIAGGVLS